MSAMQDMMAAVEPQIPGLRRYARALTHDVSSADDLVQDCLERVVSRWSQRRSDGDVKSWLFAILHNLAVSQFRQVKRRGAHVAIDDANEDAFARAPSQEDGMRHRELVARLDALPDDQRDVILLVTVEGLSYAEAARVLDIPVGTVMSRLSRGRERLLRSITADEPAHPVTYLRSVK
ncbi:RNA polymerase sigma factor [Methylopila sp. Yamaguchi]|nr:RNA polymerase sigma factor [Methylopila sp. Yamaguchi]